jgi:hypothetical protein
VGRGRAGGRGGALDDPEQFLEVASELLEASFGDEHFPRRLDLDDRTRLRGNQSMQLRCLSASVLAHVSADSYYASAATSPQCHSGFSALAGG